MLSPAGRDLLFKLHSEEREALRPQLDALQGARAGIEAAFAADSFDRAAFDAARTQMQVAEQNLSRAMGERMVKLAETLSADDRKAFAKAMGRLPMGPPGMAGGDFRPRGPMPPDAPDMPPPPRD
ncbi:MAG: periplasmic heavy metal sensor [Nevskia sp.]|nr:periplasmic heavy metal sensor [Nevskia sp.]